MDNQTRAMFMAAVLAPQLGRQVTILIGPWVRLFPDENARITGELTSITEAYACMETDAEGATQLIPLNSISAVSAAPQNIGYPDTNSEQWTPPTPSDDQVRTWLEVGLLVERDR